MTVIYTLLHGVENTVRETLTNHSNRDVPMLHSRRIHIVRVTTRQIINGRCFKFDGLPEAETLFFRASECPGRTGRGKTRAAVILSEAKNLSLFLKSKR